MVYNYKYNLVLITVCKEIIKSLKTSITFGEVEIKCEFYFHIFNFDSETLSVLNTNKLFKNKFTHFLYT